MSARGDRAATAADVREEIPAGTRVQSRVFSWLAGEVVCRSGSGYLVLIDPEQKHHVPTVRISDKEIVTETDAAIEDAQREVDRLADALERARADERAITSKRIRRGKELRAARTVLRCAQRAGGVS